MSPYVHNVPGRMRVKIPVLRNNKSKVLEIQETLSLLEGVEEISANTVTGSIVVNYDPDALKPWEILGLLEDSGYLNQSKTIANDSSLNNGSSVAGEAIGKAIFGWAVGKAFERSGLSILAAFI
jgi:copper chaperone CopZ